MLAINRRVDMYFIVGITPFHPLGCLRIFKTNNGAMLLHPPLFVSLLYFSFLIA